MTYGGVSCLDLSAPAAYVPPDEIEGYLHMRNDPDPERMKALEDRIAAAKAKQEPAPRVDEHYSQANIAWRMVIASGIPSSDSTSACRAIGSAGAAPS